MEKCSKNVFYHRRLHKVNILDNLLELMNDIGIIINEHGEFQELDSLDFITMIVSVEEEFGIIIPDNILLITVINSVSKLETIIISLMD